MLTADVDLMDLGAFLAGREHELFAQLREQAPLHFNDEPDGPGFWSLTRYEDVRWASQDAELFSSAKGTQIQDRRAEGDGTPSMHNMDAPRHKELRRLLVDRFNRDGVEEHVGERARKVVDDLLDRALEAGHGDLVELVSERLPLLVFGTWLGVPAADLSLIVKWVNILGGQEDPEYASDPQVVHDSREELFGYFSDLTGRRRAAPEDDLVSVLATAAPGGVPLRIDELLPYYMLLMFAGNDTTRNLISWSVVTFNEFPEQWSELRAVPDLVPSAIEELLRWNTPVYCMRRTTQRAFERHGESVTAGEKVVLWWPAANRDPRTFADPERFDIARNPNKHVSFGWGPHFCLGSHLLRLETQILLRRLLARNVWIEATGEPERLRSNFIRGIKRLPVRFHG